MVGDLEQRVVRKLTWRIVPFVMLLYFVAYLDRVNIGFAALQMNRDLGISDAAFGLGAGIFFLGYFLFEVPSNLILHRVGARIWIARIMFTWGIISGAMAFVQGPTSLYILRFLLGVAEAGFFPGIILYLSYWFPARYRATIIAMFMAAVPISIAIGSPISGALLELDGALGLHGWQWLFLVEAAPALLLSVVVLFYLTDKPAEAKWLGEDERAWLVTELHRDRANTATAHDLRGGLKALTDPKILALGLVYFGTSAGLYALGIWSPMVIAQFGATPLETGFLNAIPPIFAIAAMIWWARHSDRTGERYFHVATACLVASAGLVLAAGATGLTMVLVALALVNMGISAAKAPLWAIPSQYLGGTAAAAGIAAINSIGNLGGFAGPAIIGLVKQRYGGFAGGLVAVSVMLIFSAALILWLSRGRNRTSDQESKVGKNASL